ncbi:PREDICTED: uncharacterized protein LOC107074215 isoform X1 [Polistes dominula]|uniref:Uncharacterized protein LOC107074215 isoform X1 n=1 Tax=Polistes dominula TaxID=743375 RepID=A0ABM1JEQ5_POLDO|nr:PREDICTED: uncharacterized protein LOC107074215 isoform X1 [Polistes dominula]
MASGLRFYKEISDLQEEINKRDDIAKLFKREHFIAARKIQAWFRGIITRKHLSILHKEAIIIQSNWRGYFINDTLLEIHESMDTWLNDTEAIILLRNICNFAFKHYSLRKINGKRFICDYVPGSTLVTSSGDGLWETHLRDNCNEYLNEIDPLELYKYWQQWCQDDHQNPNLVTILCRNEAGKLRDCRSMDEMIKFELPSKNYQANVKLKVEFGC